MFHADGSTTSGTNTTGIDYGNTAAVNEFTLRCVATADEAESSGGADGTSNHSFKGPCKLVSNTANLAVTQGCPLTTYLKNGLFISAAADWLMPV